MSKKSKKAWMKTTSGICGNIAAAWLVVPVIGNNIHLPQNAKDIVVLTLNIVFGIVFMLLSVWLERKQL